MRQLLQAVVEKNASDLHLVVGSAPSLRIGGRVIRIKMDTLNSDHVKEFCYSVLTEKQKAEFENHKELDFSFEVQGLSRFRGNISYSLGTVSGVFRRIPEEIPEFVDLNLPDVLRSFTQQKTGLVLVTGATGSGKSTTLAALINEINKDKIGNIITIEDPIEFVHKHKKCLVRQRELGRDTDSFPDALKHILRQDPDYCLIGEMRDLDTVDAALKVAETGHLVFATLHTNSAIDTINRIVQIFPTGQQERVRVQLSFVIQGVVCQQLIHSLDGGLQLALEIMVPTPGIRNLIRENKLHQIKSLMQMGQEQTGMITMNQSIMNLVVRRKIDLKEAFNASPDPDELDRMLRKAGL